MIDPVVCRKGDTTIIGPLEFRNGELIRWGSTLRGKPLRPVERLRAGKGSRNAPPDADLGHLVRTSAPMARVVSFKPASPTQLANPAHRSNVLPSANSQESR